MVDKSSIFSECNRTISFREIISGAGSVLIGAFIIWAVSCLITHETKISIAEERHINLQKEIIEIKTLFQSKMDAQTDILRLIREDQQRRQKVENLNNGISTR